jgi:hypothetical protein
MCANIDAACCPVPTTRAAPQPASSTVLLDGPAQHKRGVTTAPAVRMPRACDNQRGGGDSTRRALGAPDEMTARHARIALAATAPVAPAAMRVALGMSSSRGGPICVKGQFVLKKKKPSESSFFSHPKFSCMPFTRPRDDPAAHGALLFRCHLPAGCRCAMTI